MRVRGRLGNAATINADAGVDCNKTSSDSRGQNTDTIRPGYVSSHRDPSGDTERCDY